MANDKGHTAVLGKRSRADSVLGNRMDEHLNYKRMKCTSDKWSKLKRLISKPDTKLCLIEVPKGVSSSLACLIHV
jgi:hypothetical protein